MHYQVKRGETFYGPYTLKELQQYSASENILSTDLVKSDEMPGWLTVADFLRAQQQAPSASGGALDTVLYGVPPDTRAAEYPWFPITTLKFVVMSICTFGLYHVYWCYKNWDREASRTGEHMLIWARSIFLGIWNFSLFSRVKDSAAEKAPAAWNPAVLGVLVLVFAGVSRLRLPFAMLSLLSFLPYLPVLATMQRVNASVADAVAEPVNSSFSALNIVGIVVGGILVLLSLAGAFLAPAAR